MWWTTSGGFLGEYGKAGLARSARLTGMNF
jgi:hypothetical protein